MGDSNLLLILPEIWLSIAGLAILLAGLAFKKDREGTLLNLALGALAVALGLVLALAGSLSGKSSFASSIVADPFGVFFKTLFLGSSFLVLLMSRRYLARSPYAGG